MPESYWLFCLDGPTGEQICTELYVPARELDDDIQAQLKSLGELQEVVVQAPDTTLQVRLLEVLDDTAVQVTDLLPAGSRLRRADQVAFDEPEAVVALDRPAAFDEPAPSDEPVEFVGVPDVVGLSHVDAFNTLRGQGYGVKTVWEWTSSFEENFVSGQEPSGGSLNLPPTVVRVFVRTLPPDPPKIPEPPVVVFE
jgi:hypothetical protein